MFEKFKIEQTKQLNYKLGHANFTGRRHSEATKQKMRAYATGRKQSEATKQKRCETLAKKYAQRRLEKQRQKELNILRRIVLQFDLEGNFVGSYKNITDAARAVGTVPPNIGKCINGHGQTAMGYVWKRLVI